MLSIAHTIISLPWALYLTSPPLIFVAAFVSHFLCDSLLHWNIFPERWGRSFLAAAVVDVGLGLLAAWWLVGEHLGTLPFLMAIAGGNAPDVLHQTWNLLGARQRWFRWAAPAFAWHEKLQLETEQVARGLVAQGMLVLAAMLLVSLRLP